jgi:hypothetical protein
LIVSFTQTNFSPVSFHKAGRFRSLNCAISAGD